VAAVAGSTLPAIPQESGAQEPAAQEAAPAARDLSSYSRIDDAFEWEYLIAPDANWEYFLGREEPSPKLEWTSRDFRGADWELGPAPFGFGEGEFGTRVDAMLADGLSTMYVRQVITVPDPLVAVMSAAPGEKHKGVKAETTTWQFEMPQPIPPSFRKAWRASRWRARTV